MAAKSTFSARVGFSTSSQSHNKGTYTSLRLSSESILVLELTSDNSKPLPHNCETLTPFQSYFSFTG